MFQIIVFCSALKRCPDDCDAKGSDPWRRKLAKRYGNAFVLAMWGVTRGYVSVNPTGSGKRVCSNCMAITQYQDGIWHSLAPEQTDRFRRFVTEYEFIRAAEGRGSTQWSTISTCRTRILPAATAISGRYGHAHSATMERDILLPLTRRHGHPLRILDLGAGNGWMSYRLALSGHLPVAVDLLTNDHDGLGAAMHFRQRITLFSLVSRPNLTIYHSPSTNLIWRSSTLRFTTPRTTITPWPRRFAVPALAGSLLSPTLPGTPAMKSGRRWWKKAQ